MSRGSTKNVLIVAYEFPPKGGSGVQRVVKWAKFLPKYGWRAHILTAKDIPSGMYDETLLAEVPPESRIEATFSLEPTRLYRAVSKLKPRRAGGGASGGPGGGGKRGATNLPNWAIRLFQLPFFPDEKIGWLPYAVAAGMRLIETESIAAIISTSPPATSHLVGRALHRRSGLPWLADFRDPWVGNTFKAPITPLHAAADRRLEARAVGAADIVTSANEATTEAFRKRYPAWAGRFHTLTNGFDPDDFKGLPPVPLDETGFNIVYSGTFYGERNPRTFLSALAELCAEDAALAEAVRVYFVGPTDPETDRLIKESGLGERVTQTGYVSHKESVAYLMSAAVLLLIVSPGAESRGHLAGKVFEYLGAGKPILALVGEGEAAALIREAGAGPVVDPREAPAIKEAISGLFQAYRAGTSAFESKAEVVARCDRRDITGRLAGFLDEVGRQ